MTRENKLSKLFTYVFVAAIFLLPIFFVPYFFNPFYNSKLLLTFIIAFLCLFAFITQSLQKKEWQLIKTPFTIPLLSFMIAVIIASILGHQYPDRQLLGTGGVYLSFAVIILLAPSVLNQSKLKQFFMLAINLAAGFLSILSILQFFGLGLSNLISQISIWKLNDNLSFTLTGMAFITIQFLSVVILSNIFDQKTWKSSLFNKIITIIAALALGINIWAVLPGGQASFQSLSLQVSTAIARESLAATKNALFGFGPDSYENAFHILKPIWFNGLSYYQASFDAAFNLPLTLIVSMGALGLLTYLFLVWKVITSSMKAEEDNAFLKVFILAVLVWQLFSPLNLVMFILLACAIATLITCNAHQYKNLHFSGQDLTSLDFNSDINHEVNQDRAKLAQIKKSALIAANLILLTLSSLALFVVAKTFTAYHLVYQSQVKVSENNAVKVYEEYGKAKNLTPKLDFIRRNNALINLDIAIAMSNKTDATAAEQEQILQLVNQAINEAKAATILDPLNYQNWYVLSQIYVQLLDVTDQAKQEAFNALAKTIAYNPSSPELRIVMGQLFLKNKDYASAITFFNQAVERKTDLSIAHYYLAQALEANEQWEEAKIVLSNTLTLLPKDSEDYKTVEAELKLVEEQAATLKDKATPKTPNQELESTTKPTPVTDPSTNPGDQTASTSSNLSELLDKQETETVLQDGALATDQNVVEN